MRKALGAAESGSTDVVTKGYVDQARSPGFTPPSGGFQMPSNPNVTVDQGVLVSGTAYYLPYDIGPQAMTITALGISLSTLQVGGTATTFFMGLYKDDGSGGYPLMTAAGLIGSGSVAVTSGTVPLVKTVAVSATLAAGRYWTGFLYYAPSAPTTVPQLCRVSAGGGMWEASTSTLWAHRRGLTITGQTALPTTQVTLVPTNNQCALVGIKRA